MAHLAKTRSNVLLQAPLARAVPLKRASSKRVGSQRGSPSQRVRNCCGSRARRGGDAAAPLASGASALQRRTSLANEWNEEVLRIAALTRSAAGTPSTLSVASSSRLFARRGCATGTSQTIVESSAQKGLPASHSSPVIKRSLAGHARLPPAPFRVATYAS